MALNARRAQPANGGLMVSLRRLGTTLMSVLHTRIELIARELELERMRITRMLLLGVGAIFFFGLGALTFTMFIIVLFWDSQRLVAIGFLTVVYLGIGVALVLIAKGDAGRAKRPFAATLAELKKDREHLASHR
jgi:uncharacterized membrane protein YqjE